MTTSLSSNQIFIWICGAGVLLSEVPFCVSLNARAKIRKTVYLRRWTAITSVLETGNMSRLSFIGLTSTDGAINTDLASCLVAGVQMICSVKSYTDTLLYAGSHVPFADKWIYVGSTATIFPTISIIGGASRNVRSFIYTPQNMGSLQLLFIQTPPLFIGSVVGGVCANTAGVSYIFAGMVRSDSGVMTGMFIGPVSGNILNGAELVNAMALEDLGPDSFMAGGLKLSDGAGMQAYLVRANSLYRKVIYGVRYTIHNPLQTDSRKLWEGNATTETAVQSMVLVENDMYVVVSQKDKIAVGNWFSCTILKTEIMTGSILQQVHVYSYNAIIQCSEITAAGLYLILVCAVDYRNNITQSVVISVNRELTFSKLPEGFTRLEETVFVAEKVAFKGTALPLTMSVDNRIPSEYTFTTADMSPTLLPSVGPIDLPSSQPSSAPSGQPSRCPTTAPSISPQPTSQPSSSRPTNTYRPSVKPSQQPTPVPSVELTAKPSRVPTCLPTPWPSLSPTLAPRVDPSTNPSSCKPTYAPSARPTRHPIVRITRTPTGAPSILPLEDTNNQEQNMYKARESMILGQVVAGLFLVWCIYQVYRWYQRKVKKVKQDMKLVREMIAQDLPGKPKYPIFTAVVGLCCKIDTEESVDKRAINFGTMVNDSIATAVHSAYTGHGASIDSPANFIDLESNIQQCSSSGSSGSRTKKSKDQAKQVHSITDQIANLESTNSTSEKIIVIPEVHTKDPPGEVTSDSSDASKVSSSTESSNESVSLDSSDDDISISKEDGADAAAEASVALLQSGPFSTPSGWYQYDFEPSDDDEVVYTISSESDASGDGSSTSVSTIA